MVRIDRAIHSSTSVAIISMQCLVYSPGVIKGLDFLCLCRDVMNDEISQLSSGPGVWKCPCNPPTTLSLSLW